MADVKLGTLYYDVEVRGQGAEQQAKGLGARMQNALGSGGGGTNAGGGMVAAEANSALNRVYNAGGSAYTRDPATGQMFRLGPTPADAAVSGGAAGGDAAGAVSAGFRGLSGYFMFRAIVGGARAISQSNIAESRANFANTNQERLQYQAQAIQALDQGLLGGAVGGLLDATGFHSPSSAVEFLNRTQQTLKNYDEVMQSGPAARGVIAGAKEFFDSPLATRKNKYEQEVAEGQHRAKNDELRYKIEQLDTSISEFDKTDHHERGERGLHASQLKLRDTYKSELDAENARYSVETAERYRQEKSIRDSQAATLLGAQGALDSANLNASGQKIQAGASLIRSETAAAIMRAQTPEDKQAAAMEGQAKFINFWAEVNQQGKLDRMRLTVEKMTGDQILGGNPLQAKLTGIAGAADLAKENPLAKFFGLGGMIDAVAGNQAKMAIKDDTTNRAFLAETTEAIGQKTRGLSRQAEITVASRDFARAVAPYTDSKTGQLDGNNPNVKAELSNFWARVDDINRNAEYRRFALESEGRALDKLLSGNPLAAHKQAIADQAELDVAQDREHESTIRSNAAKKMRAVDQEGLHTVSASPFRTAFLGGGDGDPIAGKLSDLTKALTENTEAVKQKTTEATPSNLIGP